MKTAEDIVINKKRSILTIRPSTLIIDALKIMAKNKSGSIYIKNDDKIIGYWSERNLLRNSIAENFDINTAKIGDYMVKELVTAPYNANIYQLMDIYLREYIRRILIDKNGEFIGMVYIFDVIEAILTEKNKQLKELNSLVNLEYYQHGFGKPK